MGFSTNLTGNPTNVPRVRKGETLSSAQLLD